MTAGEPAWGPELLARAALTDALPGLPSLFLEWGRWSTRLRMTHVTYPVLVWVRSARGRRHFIVSLLTVMDAAALKLALTTKLPRREAFELLLQGGQAMEVLYLALFEKRGWRRRIAFAGRFDGASAEARQALRQMPAWNSRMLAIQAASDMDALKGQGAEAVEALARGEHRALTLARAEFDHAVDVLRRSGFPIDRDIDEAWEEFRITRARYEFAAYEICRVLDAPPAPWTGERTIPTPTMWPTLAVDVLPLIEGDAPEAG